MFLTRSVRCCGSSALVVIALPRFVDLLQPVKTAKYMIVWASQSNYVPLAGTLPQDKARLLAALDEALARGRSALRTEMWRAL